MAFRLVSTDIPTIIIGRSNSLIRGSIRLVGWEKKAARIRLMEIICLQSVVDGDGTSLRLRAAQRPRAERPGQATFRVSRRAGRVRSSEWLGGSGRFDNNHSPRRDRARGGGAGGALRRRVSRKVLSMATTLMKICRGSLANTLRSEAGRTSGVRSLAIKEATGSEAKAVPGRRWANSFLMSLISFRSFLSSREIRPRL